MLCFWLVVPGVLEDGSASMFKVTWTLKMEALLSFAARLMTQHHITKYWIIQ